MSYPLEENFEKKWREKLTKYQQIAFEIREIRKWYEVRISAISDWVPWIFMFFFLF